MTAQSTLFDARATDPWTSHEAATKASRSRQHLVEAIRTVVGEADGPVTQFEIADRVVGDGRWIVFGWQRDSVRTRCKDARLRAVVGRTGVSPSGSRCLVFELAR